jgi:outer membrane receptor for ferrienterochelin and colicin|tara:strand:- start:23701 stop:25767 length:2067 start_codon:yes stop_codon:yes gene_type:complete
VKKTLIALLVLAALQANAQEDDSHDIEKVTVSGRQVSLVGEAISASQGIVGQEEIRLRPILRTGEILEFIPGMVVTQHSGTGKANQYFLRGFNLDHGTDFATFVDGMPVNMRTHGHGQGYTDLNFVIPESVQSLNYKKGVYYADISDFSGAGSAMLNTTNSASTPLVSATVGKNNFLRIVGLGGVTINDTNRVVLAGEHNTYDGPWSDISEDLDKTNVLAKWVNKQDKAEFSLTFMGYDNSWNSADQIPKRAIESGLIDELGSLDTTVGGQSDRYSLSANWRSENLVASAYVMSYSMNLWSNFTYFLDDPENGDQFEQVDDRTVYGGEASYRYEHSLLGKLSTTTFGTQFRIDDIDEVGLYHTQARQRLGVIRSDEVTESSVGAYVNNETYWTQRLRTVLGLRYDYFDFDVRNLAGVNANSIDLSPNSGASSDDITSLKASVVYTISPEWELYGAAGQGLHSNDARGTTIQIDPSSGDAVDAVDPLVRSTGIEAGLRGFIDEKLNASLSVWQLSLDSELLFVGDAGNTEASRASKRKGAEIALYYQLDQNWSIDLEYAYTDAAFTDASSEGAHIPGAIKNVVQAGVSAQFDNGLFGSLRARHFGERPLIEDNSITSDASTVFNLRAGYKMNKWVLQLDVLNLTDSDAHDIDYYYASRLSTDAQDTETDDIHYHVIEPRTLRATVMYQF